MDDKLLDVIFRNCHDALVLCKWPVEADQLPTILRSSANTAVILGIDPAANPFSVFTAEQQYALGEDIKCLMTGGPFPERTAALVHKCAVIACSAHVVDEARFLVTMWDATQVATLRSLELCYDLVAAFKVDGDVVERVYSSPSHLTVLGHQPLSCNGNIASLAHLYPASFRDETLPQVLSAFLAGQTPDGFQGELTLLNADGEEVPFEWRMAIDPVQQERFTIVFRDITDRRERDHLKETLYVENERAEIELRQLIDTANAPIFGVDTKGRVTEWNRKAASLTGFTKEEAIGEDLVARFIHADHGSSVQEVLSKALNGEETSNYDLVLYTKSGDRVEVLLNATARRDVDGTVIGVVGVGQDITAIDVERNLMNSIFEHALDGKAIIRLNEDDLPCIVRASNGLESLLQSSLRLKDPTFFPTILSAENAEVMHNEFAALKSTGKFECVIEHCSLWLRVHGHMIRDEQAFVSFTDITALEAAKLQASRIASDLTRLINIANAPMFGVDTKGRVTEWNRKAALITGFAKEEAIGEDLVARFIHADHQASVRDVLSKTLGAEETSNYELAMYTKSGDRVEVLLNATTRRGVHGNIIGVVGIGQEVTQMKRINMKERKHALALERIYDVVFELHVQQWTPAAVMQGVVRRATPSFETLFGVPPTEDPGLWPSLCSDPDALAALLVTRAKSNHCEVCFKYRSWERTVRVSVAFAPDLTGDLTLLVVCHDLSDFKERIELEKDRELASTLQHEDKNAHQSQELDAERVVKIVAELEEKLRVQRDIAHEYHPDWVDFYSAHADSCRTLRQADGILHDMVDRAREAQHEAHKRIMIRLMVRNEYVPVRTAVDVVSRIKAQLGRASKVQVHSEALPELLLDWNLLWCARRHARPHTCTHLHALVRARARPSREGAARLLNAIVALWSAGMG